jgi:hypothetical protein
MSCCERPLHLSLPPPPPPPAPPPPPLLLLLLLLLLILLLLILILILLLLLQVLSRSPRRCLNALGRSGCCEPGFRPHAALRAALRRRVVTRQLLRLLVSQVDVSCLALLCGPEAGRPCSPVRGGIR